ncbi:hypothetical protein PRIPAC_96059 [Pristionchus pacificus]|uniref:Nicotinamide-nucleotide adenylyltransferase n=1 Tax=Pristionchus pacificus TaxID=54126 RepID=A0A454Y1S1_PRIPA|nr:hypothetical protein PRIPAC_96059 [Pristionchus pacificus]|eukprot:PDM81927.1 nmat-2 [Pristionchus pacificus]
MELHRRCILLACGSFNPPTHAHFRMFILAKEALERKGVTVEEAIFSPVSSSYRHKANLVSDHHRMQMLSLATVNSFMRADAWEQERGTWSRTVEVLEHHRQTARQKYADPLIECFLVCGGDLVDTFTKVMDDGKNLWDQEDLDRIIFDFGMVVLARQGSKPQETLKSMTDRPLEKVIVAEETTFPNEVSSTLLRKALEEGRCIRFCTADPVVDYIAAHGLYGSGYRAGPGERERDGAVGQNGAGAMNGTHNGAGLINGAGHNENGAGRHNGANVHTNGAGNNHK